MTSMQRKGKGLGRPLRTYLHLEQLETRDLLSVTLTPGLLATPDDTRFGQLYGMQKIQAPSAWNINTGSSSVVVADIDTGVDYTHPDLYMNIWINQGEIPQAVKDLLGTTTVSFYDLNRTTLEGALAFPEWDADGNQRIDGKDILTLWSDGSDADGNGYTDDLIGWNFVTDTNDPFDDNGHGTHVAGTIGAMGDNGLGVVGVNWQVQIMALKFMTADGDGELEGAADAIRYAVDMGAAASNNSWSYTRGTTNDVVYQAVAYARAHQHLVIAAAGNSGVNNDTSARRAYPASFTLDNIISVAATDSRDAKANWSAYGRTSVDLGAPGVSILSTIPGDRYASYSGTSMATPHVVGTVALILAARPDLASSPTTVKSLILGNVDKVTSLATRTVSGGRLNAFKAVTAALTANASAGTIGSAAIDAVVVSGSRRSGKASADQAIFESAALDTALRLDTYNEETTPNSKRLRWSADVAPTAPARKLDVIAASQAVEVKSLLVACTGSLAVEEAVEEERDWDAFIFCGGEDPAPSEEVSAPSEDVAEVEEQE